jgi:septum formation protein
MVHSDSVSGARLILASASPRRRDLLRQIGIEADLVAAAMIDESPHPGEAPPALARRLAGAKAAAVASDHGDAFVLAADTVVACGRRCLPKASARDEARRCLELLSGRRHRVHTGVCLVPPGGQPRQRLVSTTVSFKRLEGAEIEAYLECGEWRGKAGAYAIQGRAAVFVRRLNGSYSNVVGLPLHEVAALLGGLGYPVTKALARGA